MHDRPGGRWLSPLAAIAALMLAATFDYEVRRGDTLSEIAARHGTSVRALAEANGLANPDRIYAGQTLRLTPAGTARAPAPLSRAQVGDLIERVSREYGWSPAFVKAVAWQESGWSNDVVSHAGAIGIMQVMPETGQRVSRRYGRTLDLHDPEDNIRAGVLFLDELYAITGRDARMTLAGYFQGLANVRRNGMYQATERYIDNVLVLRERFR
jgi:N-acetylmuramoyl-L-alanine amidase